MCYIKHEYLYTRRINNTYSCVFVKKIVFYVFLFHWIFGITKQDDISFLYIIFWTNCNYLSIYFYQINKNDKNNHENKGQKWNEYNHKKWIKLNRKQIDFIELISFFLFLLFNYIKFHLKWVNRYVSTSNWIYFNSIFCYLSISAIQSTWSK